MIGRLKGVLVAKQPPWIMVDVGGVGYELEAPMSTFYDLPELGREVTLCTHYAVQFTRLREAGTPIGANDLWIACHALADGCTLVTNNVREFERVQGLAIENWAEPLAPDLSAPDPSH